MSFQVSIFLERSIHNPSMALSIPVTPNPPAHHGSCVVHRKRLRTAGRLVINFLTVIVLRGTKPVSYLNATRDGLTVPRISSAISTDHTHARLKTSHTIVESSSATTGESSDGSPIVRILSFGHVNASTDEHSEGQNRVIQHQ